jgi:glycosyltransferase involved in cell wall biosynthesis
MPIILSILFLVPYPLGESPSQRFRFEQYLDILRKRGIAFEVQCFLSTADWKIFYSPGRYFRKLGVLLKGFLKRGSILLRGMEFNYIFIHREAAPIGPPFVEWIIANILKKKIIYDFDDAIWLTDRQRESIFFKTIKWRSKVKGIAKWSHKISCGNLYLCDYAYRYNHNVFLNPTTIDTDLLHNPALYQKKLTKDNDIIIGWTGSHSTLPYLEIIKEVLQRIENDFPTVNFMIIADRKPDLGLKRMLFCPWSRENEIEDLMKFDIGIMPLTDDLWAEGKCGFKALQYMALEIPAVVSAVGVNTTIVDNGVNGLLAFSLDEWYGALAKLVGDEKLRVELGKQGREKVIRNYSVRSNANNFLSLFT